MSSLCLHHRQQQADKRYKAPEKTSQSRCQTASFSVSQKEKQGVKSEEGKYFELLTGLVDSSRWWRILTTNPDGRLDPAQILGARVQRNNKIKHCNYILAERSTCPWYRLHEAHNSNQSQMTSPVYLTRLALSFIKSRP